MRKNGKQIGFKTMISLYKCQKGRDKTYTCPLRASGGERCETSFQWYLNWVVKSTNIWSERDLSPGQYRHLEKHIQRTEPGESKAWLDYYQSLRTSTCVYIVALREKYPYCSTIPLRKTTLASGDVRDKRQDHGELDTESLKWKESIS